MSTATLTTVVDDRDDDTRTGGSAQPILPTAGGLPNRTPIRARPTDRRTEKRSRILRPHGSGNTVPSPPYRWVDPFTWQDGAVYGEGQLKQQFVTNLQEVPHLFEVLQEDITDSSVADPFYQSIMFTVPLGANETWYFLEVLRWSGAGTPATNQTRFGWYTPLNASMAGTGPTVDGNGNVGLSNINLNQTLATQIEWESGFSIPEHQNGTHRLTWVEFYVSTAADSGNLECGFTTITDGIETTVYAGSTLLGLKVRP